MNHRKWLISAGAMGGAALLLRAAAQMAPPALVESWYARGLYRGLSGIFLRLGGLLPFSLGELLLVLAAVGLPVVFLVFAVRLVRRPGERRALGADFGTRCAAALAAAYLIFVLTGGLNYYRYTFAQISGLELRESSVGELRDLCGSLAREATALSGQVARDEAGKMLLPGGFGQMTAGAREAYSLLGDSYDGTLRAGAITRPKPVVLSKLMSYCRITGVYLFFTFEANINMDVPAYSIPATACHEMAHACGFMREDEANYIAYLAAAASPEPELRYSGVTLALSHSLSALASTGDQEAYSQVCALIGGLVWADFAANNAYWQRFETHFGDFAESVNDTYLKVNDQQDGARSYGRMVDLLLARRRVSPTENPPPGREAVGAGSAARDQ